MRLHAVIVHADIVSLLVGVLGLGTFAGALGMLHNVADLLEGALDVVDVGEHLVDLTLRRQALSVGLRLLLSGTAIGFGKVEDGARVRANLQKLAMSNEKNVRNTYTAEGLLVGPVLVVSGSRLVAAAGVGIAVRLGAGRIIVLVTGRDGVSGKRHLARRHVRGLVGMRGGRRRLRVAARDGAVVVVDGATVVRRRPVGLAGRRWSAIRDGRQTGTAAKRRARRVGKGGNGVLSRRERSRVQGLRRVRVLAVRVGVLARRGSKRRRQAAGAGLGRHAAVRRRVLAGASARDDFGDGGQRLAGRRFAAVAVAVAAAVVVVVVGGPTGFCGGDHAGRR